MMKVTKAQKERAIGQLHDLMLKQPQSVEGVEECWLGAEAVMESYVSAVEARSADLPARQQLGEACFYLISSVGLIRDDDNMQLIIELLTPELGIELYSLLPRVNRLWDEALAKLGELAEAEANDGAAEKVAEPANTDFDLF